MFATSARTPLTLSAPTRIFIMTSHRLVEKSQMPRLNLCPPYKNLSVAVNSLPLSVSQVKNVRLQCHARVSLEDIKTIIENCKVKKLSLVYWISSDMSDDAYETILQSQEQMREFARRHQVEYKFTDPLRKLTYIYIYRLLEYNTQREEARGRALPLPLPGNQKLGIMARQNCKIFRVLGALIHIVIFTRDKEADRDRLCSKLSHKRYIFHLRPYMT